MGMCMFVSICMYACMYAFVWACICTYVLTHVRTCVVKHAYVQHLIVLPLSNFNPRNHKFYIVSPPSILKFDHLLPVSPLLVIFLLNLTCKLHFILSFSSPLYLPFFLTYFLTHLLPYFFAATT